MIFDPLAARQRHSLAEKARGVGMQSLLLASAGLMVIVASALDPLSFLSAYLDYALWRSMLLGAVVPVVVGALGLRLFPRIGRWSGLAGIAAYFFIVVPGLLSQPSRALAVVVGLGLLWLRLRAYVPASTENSVVADPEVTRHPRLYQTAVVATSILGVAAWFLVTATNIASGGMAHAAAAATFAVAVGYAWAWAWSTFRRESGRSRWVFLILPALVMAAVGVGFRPDWSLSVLTLHQSVALLLLESRRQSDTSVWSSLFEHPARLLVATFALVCFLGGIALWLPISVAAPGGITLIDSMFMSVSATCVTGLAVVDPGSVFTAWGEVAMLLLIQFGGLGIMVFSATGVLLLGRRLGVRQEAAANNMLADEGGTDIYRIARGILRTTFLIEGVGAIVLTLLFRWRGLSWQESVWNGVFTSVSAFCNAGFALFSDNLMSFHGEAGVLHTVAMLIVLGGLGTPVIHAIPLFYRRKNVSLQSRLVLVTTAVLLVVSFAGFTILEWNHSLAAMPAVDRLHNAWFLAVSPRTAGFNAVDLTQMHPASVTLTMLLMFIGGSPFSTAGGAKTTTIALIVTGVIAALRSRGEATAFGRRISHESIYKSIAIMTVASALTLVAVGAIQLTQKMPFEMGLFEVVSALNTVGLTVGGTPRLDGVGKIIIMLCMFAGRVGPVTLFLLLTERRRDPKWAYPEEKVTVG